MITHEENAANYFATRPEQSVCRVQRKSAPAPKIIQYDELGFFQEKEKPRLRGCTKHIVTMDDAPFCHAPDVKTEAKDEIGANDRITEQEDQRILELLEKVDGDALPMTNEELADHINQKMIEFGRAPIYSAKMLAAQNAADLRKKQKRSKKSKRK